MAESTKLTTSEILRRVAKLPPEERKRAERALLLQYQPSAVVNRTPEAEELEAQGWEVWLQELAPHIFRGTHADFHRDFWGWYWPLLVAKRDGRRLTDLDVPLAYLLTIFRGGGKSTLVEWANIAMGALWGQVLSLYISSVAKLARGHLNNIREEIEDSQVTKYYPGLSNPEVGKFNNRYGWNQDLLATQSGLTIFAAGLEEEVRGLKRRQHRPGLICLDEFDSKSDSPDVVKKKESIIAGSVFGTQVPDTLILMAQNLIHGQSVALRTYKRRNELLSRRRESGLVKAFTDDLDLEMRGTRWAITKGQPTWTYFDMGACQKFLDTSGPIEFFAEYQHEFDRSKEGKVFKNYRDKDAEGFTHVITEEEFATVFGVRRPPASWNKWMFNDKSRTKSEFHANVAGTLTMSSQNTPLPGITFLYDCLTFEADAQPDDCAIEMLKCITPKVRVDGIDFDWGDLLRVIVAREGIERFTGSLYEQIQAQRAGLAKIIPRYVAPLLASQHYQKFRMSHEADDWRKVYREVFGLPYVAANPTEGAGIEMVNLAMKVDETVRDPFRPWQQGMSRFYIVVKKEKLPYPNDNKPDLLFGSDLARYQFTEHRYLPPKINALGEEERGQEKRNDDFCFVAGTMIATPQGDIPIERVRAGDYVHTRKGPRKVMAAAPTGIRPIYSVEMSNGQSLQGTADHPIWIEGRGWIPLHLLQVDDMLHACTETRNPTQNGYTWQVSPSTATPTLNKGLTGFTSCLISRIGRRASRTTTSRCGKRRMVKYQRGGRSTTLTRTRLTMISPTWSVSRLRTIGGCIWEYGGKRGLRSAGSCDTLAIARPVGNAGVGTKRRFHDTATFAHGHAINGGNRASARSLSNAPASCAVLPSKLTQNLIAKCAETPVRVDSAGELPFVRRSASIAEIDSPLLATSPSSAQLIVVKQAQRLGDAQVFNLQVEDEPEFFANGVLVHNCNGLQFFYMDHSIQARELTPEEMFEAQLAPPLQQAAIDAETDPEKKRQQHYAREVAIRRQLMAKITENLGGGRTRGSAGSRLADYRDLERLGK